MLRKVNCKTSEILSGMAFSVQGQWIGTCPHMPWGTYMLLLSRTQAPHSWGQLNSLSKGNEEANRSLRCVSDISCNPIIPISENFIFFVKLPFILTDGHSKPFLFKIRLLFFSNGCFF